MAIEIDKYLKITSGKANTNAAVRRNLNGNVFTTNDKVAHRGICYFDSADDVMSFFGSDSDEYRFAAKYFGFVSKSVTRAEKLSFYSWNFPDLDQEWKFYDFTVSANGLTYAKEEGSTNARIYDSLIEAVKLTGDHSVISIKFDSDLVTSTELYGDGIHVGQLQHVYIDLNGHKFSCLRHCVVNDGFCRITDSEFGGCMWTKGTTAYENNNSDKSLSSTIVSSGRLVIDHGWFGIGVPVYSYSAVNAGPAVEIVGGEATINGGAFTCKSTTQSLSASETPKKAAKSLKANAATANYTANSFIVTCAGYSRLEIKGGTFFGLPLGCVACRSASTDSVSRHPAVTIRGGNFYAGLPRTVAKAAQGDTWLCFVWSGSLNYLALQPTDIPYSNATEIGGILHDKLSYVRIEAGIFKVNVSSVLSRVKSNDIYHMFRGLVSVNRKGYYTKLSVDDYRVNYKIDESFYQYEKEIETYERTEKPVEALVRCNRIDDNFGAYCFLEHLTPTEIGEVAAHNATYNYKYLFSVDFPPDECKLVLRAVGGVSGTCFTLDKFNDFAKFMPMALFAATKYDRVNTTKVFMYQQFAGEKPSVETTTEANRYDAFDVDGMGTRYPVNYYGCTQQAGDLISFYQDGYNADGIDTACYCNEVWMKDAIAVELLNTFIAMEKIPANAVGEAMVKDAIISVLNEAITNGVIVTGKKLDNVQRTYVDRVLNEADAWNAVEDLGYSLKVEVKHRTLLGGRVQYYADYILVYSKGDAIRKVEGSDILI